MFSTPENGRGRNRAAPERCQAPIARPPTEPLSGLNLSPFGSRPAAPVRLHPDVPETGQSSSVRRMESASRPFKACGLHRRAVGKSRETSAVPGEALGVGREASGSLMMRSGMGREAPGDLPEGSGDLPEGSADLLEGSSDLLEGSTDLPECSSDLPEGSGDLPEGSGDLPEGSSDLLLASDSMIEPFRIIREARSFPFGFSIRARMSRERTVMRAGMRRVSMR